MYTLPYNGSKMCTVETMSKVWAWEGKGRGGKEKHASEHTASSGHQTKPNENALDWTGLDCSSYRYHWNHGSKILRWLLNHFVSLRQALCLSLVQWRVHVLYHLPQLERHCSSVLIELSLDLLQWGTRWVRVQSSTSSRRGGGRVWVRGVMRLCGVGVEIHSFPQIVQLLSEQCLGRGRERERGWERQRQRDR